MRPCAFHAARKRREMTPMVPQTRSEEMPVRLRSQVKTTPSPQMVVRKETNETASDSLRARVCVAFHSLRQERGGKERRSREGGTHRSAGTGTPRELTQLKMCGAWPDRARDRSMRELA